MNARMEKAANVVAVGLGVVMFAFGFLKLFNPFHAWYESQIANSGLPSASFALGIVGELSIGVAFLASVVARRQLRERRYVILALASLGLIVMMAVATYVHLHPDVPAAVLPLGIKPPFIPLAVLVLAAGELVLAARLRAA